MGSRETGKAEILDALHAETPRTASKARTVRKVKSAAKASTAETKEQAEQAETAATAVSAETADEAATAEKAARAAKPLEAPYTSEKTVHPQYDSVRLSHAQPARDSATAVAPEPSSR